MTLKSLQPWVVTFLLFCMVAFQAAQFGNEIKKNGECEVAIDAAAGVIASQHGTYLELFDEYETAAYGDSVDRISEQQLLAAEAQLAALQIIASQNDTLIGLVSACR
jgi:hypothetical protein